MHTRKHTRTHCPRTSRATVHGSETGAGHGSLRFMVCLIKQKKTKLWTRSGDTSEGQISSRKL